jgi:hypothetical protein
MRISSIIALMLAIVVGAMPVNAQTGDAPAAVGPPGSPVVPLRPALIEPAVVAPAVVPPTAQLMSAEDFGRELVNVPLCGTPKSGPYAGKAVCTIQFNDGTAAVMVDHKVARGVWSTDGRSICRREVGAAESQRRCVTYERLSNGHYRNSDGVEFCAGACPEPQR